MPTYVGIFIYPYANLYSKVLKLIQDWNFMEITDECAPHHHWTLLAPSPSTRTR